MREVKFRGLDREGNWFIGSHLKTGTGMHYIVPQNVIGSLPQYTVIAGSVGQYTGLRDINGEEIFEGHIVESNWGYRFPIFFEDGCYKTESEDFEVINENQINYYGLKVVGNLYEHPNLLEVAE